MSLQRSAIAAGTRWAGSVLLLLLLVGITSGPARGQETFSIEEVLSAPFPEGLVSAPQAGVVAWVYNAQGVRNVWVRVGQEAEPRQVTFYKEDDGQGLGSLTIKPDGSDILFLRGGGPNRSGEFPNPLSWTDGAGSSLWIVPVHGGEPRRIKYGGGVRLSPDGSRIAFSSGNTISFMGLEEGAEAEEMATVRGNPSSLTWSPDGARLAFVSNRGDHAFIGILDPENKSIRYLDPSLTLDQNPVWSPDGRFIAHTRTHAEERTLPFAPIREGLPWSIRVLEVSTGLGHTIWTANKGPGSVFHGVSSARQIHWAAGNHIVFPWEGDGWSGLYSVSASGGDVTDLTPGLFEVQFVAMAVGGEDVLFSSNQDDIDRQHVWRASVDGSSLELLTAGTGIEWSPVSADADGGIAFLASGATTPARAEVRNPSGGRELLLPPQAWDRFPSDALVEPEQIVFSAADGMAIHGQLFLPPNHGDGQKRPALLFFHGGSRRQMLLGFHHRGYYHNAYAFNQYLASQGYVVLAVNYRSGTGYGMEFREALDYGATGASEFNDVLGAGLYLQSRDDVDPKRIGLWGGSYGGYLTALGLARASDLFAAGVDLHGVHDWNVVINGFVPSYRTIEHPDFAELAFRSSPMADIDGWRSPVLLIHGDDDRNVPFSESVDLAVALTRQGVEYEELVFPDEVHGFLLHRNWIAAYRASADFFERKLHPGR